MKNRIIESVILAVGLALAGLFVCNGLSDFSARSRVVTVKGLAEMEVKADKVTWPLTYKVLGNDLVSLYNEIKEKASRKRKSVSTRPKSSTPRPTATTIRRNPTATT